MQPTTASRSSTDRAAPGAPGGFTLLEVMIALAILSVSLVALAGINSGAMNMHAYAKRLTVATFLARGKMADLEQKLQSEGLPADDEVEDGTFEEEGYPEYRWEAQIIRPKTEDLNVNNLLAMTGMGLEAGGESGGDPLKALGPLADKLIGGQEGGGLTSALGAMGGQDLASTAMAGAGGLLGSAMQSQLQTMVDQLGKTMREVRLTVSWGEEKKGTLDQFTVTTHVVSLGAGTDQAQSDVAAQAAAAAASGTAATGTPAGGPIPGPIPGQPPVQPNGLNQLMKRFPFNQMRPPPGMAPNGLNPFGGGKKP